VNDIEEEEDSFGEASSTKEVEMGDAFGVGSGLNGLPVVGIGSDDDDSGDEGGETGDSSIGVDTPDDDLMVGAHYDRDTGRVAPCE
jgi:hypothetical protein